tara:strand:- start:98736 stop:99524 length:789 start_codon:yes stop_codon:yes gene_type:complete
MKILEEIITHKLKEVSFRKKIISYKFLESSYFFLRKCYSLKNILNESTPGVIAEFKRRSPSKQIINNNLSIHEVAKTYENSGAVGISVLTDLKFFGGSEEDLNVASFITKIPILRKDFIIDEFQVIESKSFGADIILLIASILNKNKIKELSSLAKSLGLEVLLEIHDIKELNDYYLNNIDIIGVNNRNLKDFSIDINISKKISDKIPSDFKKISESGISDINVIKDLKNYGYSGFLIGEKFMIDHKKESISRFIKNINNET